MRKYKHKMHLKLKKGALHRVLGISPGKRIPTATLNKHKNSRSALTRKRIQFAINARRWKH